MHRVELKGCWAEIFLYPDGGRVPNAPCGVESVKEIERLVQQIQIVPNAPCGVESKVLLLLLLCNGFVPNAPCGVESYLCYYNRLAVWVFVPNAPCGVESTTSLHQKKALSICS